MIEVKLRSANVCRDPSWKCTYIQTHCINERWTPLNKHYSVLNVRTALSAANSFTHGDLLFFFFFLTEIRKRRKSLRRRFDSFSKEKKERGEFISRVSAQVKTILFHEAPVWDTVLLLQSILSSETHSCLLKQHHYRWLSVTFTVFTKNKCLRPADWLMEGLVSLALFLRHQWAVTVWDKFCYEWTEHRHHAVWQSCFVTLQIKRLSISHFPVRLDYLAGKESCFPPGSTYQVSKKSGAGTESLVIFQNKKAFWLWKETI